MGKRVYQITPDGPDPEAAKQAIAEITAHLVAEQEVRLEIGRIQSFYVIVEVVNK